jgi:hypothetical protein
VVEASQSENIITIEIKDLLAQVSQIKQLTRSILWQIMPPSGVTIRTDAVMM